MLLPVLKHHIEQSDKPIWYFKEICLHILEQFITFALRLLTLRISLHIIRQFPRKVTDKRIIITKH